MKKIILLLFMATVVASGCKKFLDVNNNPNQPLVVTPNVVLSAALTGSAGNIATDYPNVNRYMGYWSRSGNFVSDPINEQYQFNNGMTDGEWSNLYGTLNRYHYIYVQGVTNKLPFYVAVAQTMMALHFSTLVDVYGDVPYTEAFDPVNHQQPKYDDAQKIYTALILKLDSAVANFEAAKSFYASAASSVVATDDQYDLLFGKGNSVAPSTRMDMWETFANTVKLKLLLHESQVSSQAAFITAEIAKITANGKGFLGADQSAYVNPGYTASTGKINPFYALFYTPTATNNDQGYYRANTYAENFYEMTGDERMNFFYGAPYSGSTGLPNGTNYDGDPQSQPNAVTSQLSGNGNTAAFGGDALSNTGTLKDFTQDQLIISDFESLFMQAEAAQRGWISGNPGDFYTQAVEQNFVYLNAALLASLGITADAKADADIYLQGAAGGGILTAVADDTYSDYDTSPDKLGCIMTQKWASLNSINWVEAWTDYRRTGYPVKAILDISKATTHVKNAIPLRYLYPQSELNTNAANVPKLAAPAQYVPIFWDQN